MTSGNQCLPDTTGLVHMALTETGAASMGPIQARVRWGLWTGGVGQTLGPLPDQEAICNGHN